jgi:ATP-binding cassette, subfamily C, bacterial LapB
LVQELSEPINEPVKTFEVSALAKALVLIASKHGLRVKSTFVSETIRSSPSEPVQDILIDVCSNLGLSYNILKIENINFNENLEHFLLIDHEQSLFACSKKSDGNIKCLNLLNRETFSTTQEKIFTDFQDARVVLFGASDEPYKNVANRMKLLNPLYGFGSGNFLWVATASFFSNILGLATSLFIMVVYDRVLPNQANNTLYALAIGVGIAVVFDQLLKFARSSIIEYTATNKDKHISNEIFEQFVDTRVRNSTPVGSLSTIIKDFETFKDFATSATILALIDLPFIFIFVYVISIVGAQLFIIPLICIPIVVISVLAIQPFLFKSTKALSDANKSRQGYLVELLTGLDVLRVNGAFSELRRRFVRESRSFSTASARAKNLGQFSGNIVYVVQQLSQVSVIVYGFHLFVNQDITMGAIIATMILSGKTLAPLAKLSQTLAKLNSAIIARNNVREFLQQRRKNILSEESVFEVSQKKGIEIDNVTLRLSSGSKPLFSQLNIRIERGERVAVIGKAGSGKTSLIKLICGLSEAEVGSVFVDGADVTAIERSSIYHKIGVCFQDPWIFAGSIRENIALGHDEITDEQIVNSLTLAGGHALGNDLHSVLNGICTDRGGNLSGGQKQIISLARALVFDAEFLLLDEPTSSMDTAMEAEFLNTLKEYGSKKTIVLVTHKPSLLQSCDRVIIMDSGQVAWDGSFSNYLKLIKERKAALK